MIANFQLIKGVNQIVLFRKIQNIFRTGLFRFFFLVVYAGLHAWTTFGNNGPGSSDPPFEILNQDPTKSSGSGYATLTKTNLVFRKNRDTRFRPRIKIL